MAVVSKTKRLTKEDILSGISRTEAFELDVVIKGEVHKREVLIRPLSDVELSKIFSVIGPVPILPDGTPDTSKVELDKNFDALRLAASLGMVDPKVTLEEIGNWTFPAPALIGMRILSISGLATPEELKKKD